MRFGEYIEINLVPESLGFLSVLYVINYSLRFSDREGDYSKSCDYRGSGRPLRLYDYLSRFS